MQFLHIFYVSLIPLILLLRIASSDTTSVSPETHLLLGNFFNGKTSGATNDSSITDSPIAVYENTSVDSRQILHDVPSVEFIIEKDQSEPSTLLNVFLPQKPTRFKSFFVKVVDVSSKLELPERDSNRTFLASPTDIKVINARGLHPGHQYSVSIVGRRDGESVFLKEYTVTMNPVAPDFWSRNATVLSSHNNITLRALKPVDALQDIFRVTYVQEDPPKVFPKLEVHDIIEQKHIEIYIGNLNPGRNYNVSVVSIIGDLESKPWTGILTTRPLSPLNLTVTDLNSSCVKFYWDFRQNSGVDRFSVQYGLLNESSKNVKLNVPKADEFVNICGLHPGRTFTFSIKAEKNKEASDLALLDHTLRPRPPENLTVTVDYQKRKFLVSMTVAPESESFAESCNISIVSERLEEKEMSVSVEPSKSELFPRRCFLYTSLQPGVRYEISAVTISKGTKSAKLSKNFALEPAFDMKEFGLTLQEVDQGLRLNWPQGEMALGKLGILWENVVGNESSLHLSLEPQSQSAKWKEQSRKFEMRLGAEKPLVVPNLASGACYRVQVYTVTKSGIVSTKRFEEYLRISAPPMNITTDEVSKTSAQFRLILADPVLVESSECSVNVVVFDMHSMAVYDRTLILTSDIAPIVLQGLRPFHKYTINTQIICGKGSENKCPPRVRTLGMLTFETRQDRPGPVQNLTVRPLNPYSVQLSWMPPALPNGVITHYIARIHPMEDNENEWSVNVGATPQHMDHTVNAVVDNLIGGLAYRMDVRAVTEAGEGDISAASDAVLVLMPVLPPPQPTSRIEILHNTIRSSDVTVRYSTAMFSTKHGLLTKSAVIVIEVTDDGKTNEFWAWEHRNTTPTWREVQRFDVWPPYIAIETPIEPIRKFFPTRVISEIVGVDGTCQDVEAEFVCNGPLKPGSNYKFKLRLYTAPNLWTDTDYSEIVTTEWSRSRTTLGSILVILGVLIAVAVASLFALLIWNSRKKSCPPTFGSTQPSSKESQWVALKMMMAERAADCLAKLGLDSQHVTSACSTNVPEPTTGSATLSVPFGHHRSIFRSRSLRERTGADQRLERLPSGPPLTQKIIPHTVVLGTNTAKSRPVRVPDFAEHVRLMSADSDFRFSEEYDDLKLVGNGQPCIAADLTVNRAKNRFTNILPYDHSRVKLIPADDEEGSDYLNASYIPGFNSRREFIAAQGPLPSTRDHFWRAVWEQQCPAIVALTKCVEKGRDKCHQYWPDSEQLTVLYADIEVTLMNETVYEEFTIRELQLTNLREPSSTPRNVTHFHYMAWPDFGVPDNAVGIVHFARLFRRRLPPSPSNKPTVVHCSAGVGRSGTFIALDRSVQAIGSDKQIDVFGVVYEMRMERCHMVQNEQQYIFIHQCLLHVLETEYPHFVKPFRNPDATLSCSYPPQPEWLSVPRIEVHQNPAFEDDEGIAESGL